MVKVYVKIKETVDFDNYFQKPAGVWNEPHRVFIKEYDDNNGIAYLIESDNEQADAVNFMARSLRMLGEPPEGLKRLYVDPEFELKDYVGGNFTGYVWILEEDVVEMHSNKEAKEFLRKR